MTNASLKESRLRLGLTQKIIGKTEKGKKMCPNQDKCKNYEPERAQNPFVDLICEGDVEDLSCIIEDEKCRHFCFDPQKP